MPDFNASLVRASTYASLPLGRVFKRGTPQVVTAAEKAQLEKSALVRTLHYQTSDGAPEATMVCVFRFEPRAAAPEPDEPEDDLEADPEADPEAEPEAEPEAIDAAPAEDTPEVETPAPRRRRRAASA